MTCTCQKLQGVIYRRKDGSFYLLDDTCAEHGGIRGTRIGYIILDEATGAELGSAAAPTLAVCPDCHFMLPHAATSSCIRNMKVAARAMPPCEACELEKKNGSEYMNHSCTRRASAAPPSEREAAFKKFRESFNWNIRDQYRKPLMSNDEIADAAFTAGYEARAAAKENL